MIEVLRAGLLTTVQDLGRSGSRHWGVGRCGVMDGPAVIIGNRLLGNDPNAASLEIHAGLPVQLTFRTDTHIVLTGAELISKLDQEPIWPGWRIPVQRGQTLTLGTAQQGARAYLTISGGIDVPLVLGSRSTDLNAGFGGWHGRALRTGDRLPLGPTVSHPSVRGLRLLEWSSKLRAIPGPEYEDFSPLIQQTFWRTHWKVQAQSNRMGYRLQGPALLRIATNEVLSHAVLPGTVQVPPKGEPIVLLADAQTTGGYPRIATVIEADLWKLAQIPLGGKLNFTACTVSEARTAWHALQNYLKRIARVTHAD